VKHMPAFFLVFLLFSPCTAMQRYTPPLSKTQTTEELRALIKKHECFECLLCLKSIKKTILCSCGYRCHEACKKNNKKSCPKCEKNKIEEDYEIIAHTPGSSETFFDSNDDIFLEEDNDNCVICGKELQTIEVTTCGHAYHKKCLLKSCPVCIQQKTTKFRFKPKKQVEEKAIQTNSFSIPKLPKIERNKGFSSLVQMGLCNFPVHEVKKKILPRLSLKRKKLKSQ